MMKMLFASAAIVLFAAPSVAQLAPPQQIEILETSALQIASGDLLHDFVVELADDRNEIQRGLMDRTEMAPDAGMLFDFGEPRRASMWMKNTLLPLDMLFIDEDGTILAIAKDTEPMSTRVIDPGFRIKSVLELNAGRSDALGIVPGDKVLHPIFGNTGPTESDPATP